MTKHLEHECDTLPDKSAAREFYAKYEPKEVIGRGISSTVRLCIEKETGQKFAAKIIDINDRVDNSIDIDANGIREATMREIRILRTVAGHPYIIELHDVFESSAFIFLIFELCRGGELFDYLTGVVSLSEKKTRYVMKQIFQAVKHFHDKNVVHRDLKPENILLDDDLNVKITDFGFAEELKSGQKLFDMCGTPGYLAPEVLKCNMYEDTDGYSFEVDNWACGVIMYILLVGYPPFWHRKQIIMLRNIMDGQYSFNSSEWSDISELPKDLIRRLLIVDPKFRISIDDALNHDFFNPPTFYQKPISVFNARKKFRHIIRVVMITIRIQRYRYLTEDVLNFEAALTDPYRIRILRKLIDACAFGVYAHWVKKSDGQNRAALFENSPKIDLKQLYVNRLNQ